MKFYKKRKKTFQLHKDYYILSLEALLIQIKTLGGLSVEWKSIYTDLYYPGCTVRV